MWTNQLEWSGQKQFEEATYTQFEGNGESQGEYKNYEKFTFYRVYNAGHMVPMDQPAAALNMISTYISNGGYLSKPSEEKKIFA
jgi:cathepsin A (carboxypeptidase C)